MVKTKVKKSVVEDIEEVAEKQLSEAAKLFLDQVTSPKLNSTSFILNRTSPSKLKISPLLLGAVGAQTYFHEDGELATAQAASKQGVPFIVSSHSSYSMEEISDAVPDSELWFQAHIFQDLELTKHFIQRAELAGYQAIILSVSNDKIHHQADQLVKGTANFVVDPIFTKKNYLSKSTLTEQIAHEYQKRYINWDDIQYLKQFTTLPIFIYGDLSLDDVRSTLEQQVEGIILSNINQSNLDLLEKIDIIASERLTVVVETEVKAKEELNHYLQQGADAISIRKSYIYGLATSGVLGAEEAIAHLFT
ncbi:FMN-dependent dehydrogenase, includes L-lactate dehydrogenase and type II isopentenyl diphosphate isomerase [Gracilibacillus orientalis]|uniref:FMN-dependent dehydrogenase, includes L-lactate dehydrogenase and type II isopentenyl diphosphate isomerase n=1 Tax=Gracilibacillus orientalis TaxID=334253 RepID=A0A1I4P3E4_9BACI|nr:alpha-hydroxy-acid oxidizing protein [Gracilibacillus orientalis]SFM21893.1 FMN-dependent dehydrogenase, includes L-lactate dehydrogenase and type II isopentenyl diphosphate isomerase [Gracilibacillus orientalis]